jgi:hypothetical protein
MASLIDKFGYGLGLCVEKVRGYGEAEAFCVVIFEYFKILIL